MNVYFYVIFSDLKALFPLVYFMQNREDRFQDYVGKVELNGTTVLLYVMLETWFHPDCMV